MGIRALTLDGDRFDIPFRECQLEIGGFSGRMIFCRNQDRSLTIFCEDRTFPSALSSASAGILDQQLGDSLKQRRRESRRGKLIVTSVLVAIVLMLVGGYFGIQIGARAAVRAVPVSVDREIGTMAFESMDLEGPEVTDPKVVEAIQTMVDRLAPHAALDGLDFDVHVIDSPMVNAFALPGGTIVVFTGLIAESDEPEQVAGCAGPRDGPRDPSPWLAPSGAVLGACRGASFAPRGYTGGCVGRGATVSIGNDQQLQSGPGKRGGCGRRTNASRSGHRPHGHASFF